MIIKAIKNGKEIDLDKLFTRGFKKGIEVTYKCDKCGKFKKVKSDSLVHDGRIHNQLCLSCSMRVNNTALKRKETCIKKYGHDNPMHVKEFVDKCKNSAIESGMYDEQSIKLDFIREEFSKEGYTLLSTEYINNKTKLKFICPNGHKGNIKWNGWTNGYRCRECSYIDRSSKQRANFDNIKKSFKSEGYTLLTNEYINNRQKLEFVCPKGHKSSTTWVMWSSQGRRCKVCSTKKRAESQRLTYEYVKASFDKRGYKLLSTEYKDAVSKLKYICPKGHIGEIRWHNWQHGYGCNSCPKVKNNVSKAENEIYSLIKSRFNDAEHGNRLLIKPFELDIVIPNKKTAIEYCGLLWHSEIFGGKDKNYHLNKLKSCLDKGYRLITIFEDEWLYKRDIVESRLWNILGVSENFSVPARKCSIQEIESKLASNFLEKNHLQGKGQPSIRLGAFYQDKLVSVMTFSKPVIAHGGNPSENGVFELNRFCSDKDYRIVGIASRLLKKFNELYNPKSVFSFADRRWSDGNLYSVLGFDYKHDTNPNYWYIVGDKRLHRFNFRKSVLDEKLNEFNPELSEFQNMKNNGFDRIWDCGNIRFTI